jgi:pyruvate formate lyase activating enzyme
LENIKRADASPHDFDLVIRTPLIPGLNDSDDAIKKSAEFIKGLKKIKFMEFLAYHRLGTETYKNMGLEYPLQEIKTPSLEFMKGKAIKFQEIAGVPVRINGIPLNN